VLPVAVPAQAPHAPARAGNAEKIVEGFFSMEISRAYRKLFFHQEKSFQDLLQEAATPDS
jgi:hypothetical protein